MPSLTLKQAQILAGGRIRGSGDASAISLWAYDTRLPFREHEACFVALAGPHRSGAVFVEQAYRRGVRLFCVSEHDTVDWKADSTYWIVEDVLVALQRLAKAVRQQVGAAMEGEIVGITGSNGKTIVKEWLYTLLGGAKAGVYRSPASFNSQLGVALSILHLPADTRIAIFEAGISKAGEMQKLEEMIAPTLGLLTNIGSAHDAGFSGSEEKTKEKLSLFRNAKQVIYQAGNPSITRLMHDLRAQRFAWSQNPAKRVSTMLTFGENSFQLTRERCADELEVLEFPLPYSDAASRENLANAVLAAIRCGARVNEIRERIPLLQQTDLRLSLTTGRQGSRLIDDTYNADIEGLEAALQFFSQHVQPNGQRILVLGPLLESGLDEQSAATKITELIQSVDFDQLLTIGEPLAVLKEIAHHQHFDTVDNLEAHLLEMDLAAATLLIKGPRALQLDRISKTLQRQTHPVRLEINLDTLAQNLAVFRSRLRSTTKICMMIKASAYGSGSVELVRFFEQRGIDYLAVANVDEGVELRKAGTVLPIIVANAQRAEFARMIEFQLDAEVKNLQALVEIGRSGLALKLHLKIDTGMHRLGFIVDEEDENDLDGLLKELKRGAYQIESVFSHLVASDMESGDGFSRTQNNRLQEAAERIDKVIGYRPMVHLLNSSGAFRMPEFQHDMVRLGIGLYGVDAPSDSGLTPAHRLLAQVVQVKKVKAGGYVGYGLKGQSKVDRIIGVVNIGYADGLRRKAGHGAYSLAIAGKRCPTVGSICMDFCMVDITESERVNVGDEVEIFGETVSISELAKVLETIPYEVLTGIGRRVQRVYYR